MNRLFFITLLASLLPILNLWAEAPSVQITGEIDTGSIVVIDAGTKAALDTNAADEYDPFLDRPKPPHSPTNYLSVYFPHPEWHCIFGDNFIIDARNGNDDLTNNVKVFAFEVLTDLAGETVSLNFTISPNYPANYGVILYDYTTQTYRNLREEGEYSYLAGSTAREFDLRLGDGTDPVVDITFPTPDIILYSETAYQLTWEYTDISPIRYSLVYYSLDNGLNWTFIDSVGGGAGTCSWITPATASNTVKIKVEAEDWAGNFGTEIMDYTFILDNHTLPIIDIVFPTDDTLLFYNTVYQVNWTTTTNVTPYIYNILYYSLDDGMNWTQIDSIPAELDLTCSWITPTEFSTYAKLKVVAEDAAGNVGTEVTDYTFNLAPNYMEIEFAPPWNLLSVPLMTDSNSIQAIFGDDIIGPYFVYNFSQAGGGFSFAEEIQHGKAYWLALLNASTVDVPGLPEVDSTHLALEQGWNMVGSAIAANVLKEDLYFTNGVSYLSFNAAVDSGWILPGLYGYDNPMGNYVLEDYLEPWGGYWLYSLINDYEMVTYPPYPGIATEGQLALQNSQEASEQDWFIPVNLCQGTIANKIAGFGTNAEATDDFDVWYDVPMPPPPPNGDYLHIVFEHPEWSLPMGSDFCRDIQAAFDFKNEFPQIKEWQFIIEASNPGLIKVNFLELKKNLPDGFAAYAIYNGITQNILEVSWFAFIYSTPLEVTIRILNQTAAIIFQNGEAVIQALPEDFSIMSIHPNPFNSTATIKIALPLTSELSIKVFNIEGGLVANLSEGSYPAGYYNFSFNGNELASGIYFVKVTTPGRLDTIRKIILIK